MSRRSRLRAGGGVVSCARPEARRSRWRSIATTASSIGCATSPSLNSGGPPINGVVKGTDGMTLTIDECPPDQSCGTTQTTTVTFMAPGLLTPIIPTGNYVEIEFDVTVTQGGCVQRLQITDLPTWDMMNNPGGLDRTFWLAAADGAETRSLHRRALRDLHARFRRSAAAPRASMPTRPSFTSPPIDDTITPMVEPVFQETRRRRGRSTSRPATPTGKSETCAPLKRRTPTTRPTGPTGSPPSPFSRTDERVPRRNEDLLGRTRSPTGPHEDSLSLDLGLPRSNASIAQTSLAARSERSEHWRRGRDSNPRISFQMRNA